MIILIFLHPNIGSIDILLKLIKTYCYTKKIIAFNIYNTYAKLFLL